MFARFFRSTWFRALAVALAVSLISGAYEFHRSAAAQESKGCAAGVSMTSFQVSGAVGDRVKAALRGQDLDFSALEGLRYQGTDLVRVPGPDYGGAVAVLDQNGNVTSTMLIDNEIVNGKALFRVYQDGQLTVNATMNETSGALISGWALRNGERVDLTSLVSADGYLSCLNSCLASMGVPAWIIAGLGIACGIVCAGTLGVGCIACVYAEAAILGGTLGWCDGQCR